MWLVMHGSRFRFPVQWYVYIVFLCIFSFLTFLLHLAPNVNTHEILLYSISWYSLTYASRISRTLVRIWGRRTGYAIYNKLALSKVENMKATIFSSGHLISLLTKPHNQKWLPFGKMHERLVIIVSKTAAFIRILINFRVIYDVYKKIFAWPHLSMYTKLFQ